MGQGGIAGALDGRCSGRAGEIQLHIAAAQLVLQLQNNALGDFFADALGCGEHFLVTGHDSKGEVLRTTGGQNSHGGLGTDTVDGGQQFITPLLLPADEAVKVEGIFPDGFSNVEPGILVQFQLAGSIGGDTAAVAYTTAVDDRKAGLQYGNIAGNIIKHRNTSQRFWIWARREVEEREWHRAMAMASAASSGLGIFSRCRSRRVISITWCLVALP